MRQDQQLKLEAGMDHGGRHVVTHAGERLSTPTEVMREVSSLLAMASHAGADSYHLTAEVGPHGEISIVVLTEAVR